jgi:hypothetical protein
LVLVYPRCDHLYDGVYPGLPAGEDVHDLEPALLLHLLEVTAELPHVPEEGLPPLREGDVQSILCAFSRPVV